LLSSTMTAHEVIICIYIVVLSVLQINLNFRMMSVFDTIQTFAILYISSNILRQNKKLKSVGQKFN